MGICRGDHVMIRCTQNIDYLTVFTALQYMQVLVVPIEKSTSAERAVEIGQRVDAACLNKVYKPEGNNNQDEG